MTSAATTVAGAPSDYATNACASCKHGKRRCDRLKPSCTPCARYSSLAPESSISKANARALRVRRACLYHEDPVIGSSGPRPSNERYSGSIGHRGLPPSGVASPLSALISSGDFRSPAVDAAIRAETWNTFGSLDDLYTAVGFYFGSVHQRYTIISKPTFMERLAGFGTSATADFAALCLAMKVVIQWLPSQTTAMHSSLYVNLKCIIGILDALGYHTLVALQVRLLCAFYELGHGMLVAASATVSACTKLSKDMQLDRQGAEVSRDSDRISSEERRRVWWALVCLDRFICLSLGDASMSTQDAKVDHQLPTDDSLWIQEKFPSTAFDATLGTTHDIRVGQFARECQVSHLAGRVLRHVFDPAPDKSFQQEEASQLDRTLLALMPILSNEEVTFGRYCSALGICSSALYLLYDCAAQRGELDANNERCLDAMEPLSTQITSFSRRLFGGPEAERDYSTFSPYVPLSLYQSAVVQLRLYDTTGETRYQEGLMSLKEILRYFARRWTIACE